MRIAVFPGSFDPLTNGHRDIVLRALSLFDEIIIAIGNNNEKNCFFSLEKRKQLLEQAFSMQKKITVKTYDGLTVKFCKDVDASYILRGLRTSADFEYEKAIAQMNLAMQEKIETIFLIAKPEFSALSSSIIRDIARNGGDISDFVPRSTDDNNK